MSSDGVSSSRRQKTYLQFLEDKGYICELVGNGEIRFVLQESNLHFFLVFDKKDTDYLQLVLPGVYSLKAEHTEGIETDWVYEAANRVMMTTKAVKVIIHPGDEVDLDIQVVTDHWAIFSVFHRYVSILASTRDQFYEKILEIRDEARGNDRLCP